MGGGEAAADTVAGEPDDSSTTREKKYGPGATTVPALARSLRTE
jgi:hypothetical protein